MHREPRDRRTVFFQHPDTHEWHPLRWTGLPPEGEVPPFGDMRVEELLTVVRKAGLKPKSDAELLEPLMDLIGAHDPVTGWPTRMTKSQRTQHAREVMQAKAAAEDRPGPSGRQPIPQPTADLDNVIPLTWPQRSQQSTDAVDDERRRRREAAVPVTPKPPPTLGSRFRERSVFVLPDEEEDCDDGSATR